VTAPAIVLVHPQLGENIGFAARAMLNCGLTELRLVKPRDGWPNPKALAAAAGADRVIEGARVFETLAEAVADVRFLLATTARPRDMAQRVYNGREGAATLHAAAARGETAAVMFGPEASGLTNDDLTLADGVIEIPLNPEFASLNLAQAVLVVAYEWFCARNAPGGRPRPEAGPEVPRAPKEDVIRFFAHLEAELDASGFFRAPPMRPVTVRNIRNIFNRAGLSESEVRTLRGIVTSLARRGRGGEEGGKS
jgi:tRNA/rRNA methyltransferase